MKLVKVLTESDEITHLASILAVASANLMNACQGTEYFEEIRKIDSAIDEFIDTINPTS